MSQEKGDRLTQEELERAWPVGTQVIDSDEEGYVWTWGGRLWWTEDDPEAALESLTILDACWGPLYWPKEN